MFEKKSHSAPTIYAVLQKLEPTIKELVLSTNVIHYWIDLPTLQHRNKKIFYIIRHHEELSGASAAWNYFEAGYGKGPCDGNGGTAKRMADDAVKQGKFIRQDAYDFYSWKNKLKLPSATTFFPSKKRKNVQAGMLTN